MVHSLKTPAESDEDTLQSSLYKSPAQKELNQAHLFEYKAQHPLFNPQSSTQKINARNAMWYYLRAALRRDKEAEYKIGIGYLNGELSLDRSYTHAEKWLNQAIEHGHPKAKKALEQALNQISNS